MKLHKKDKPPIRPQSAIKKSTSSTAANTSNNSSNSSSSATLKTTPETPKRPEKRLPAKKVSSYRAASNSVLDFGFFLLFF